MHFSGLRDESSGMTRRKRTSRFLLLFPVLAWAVAACAQQSDGRPEFEVAAIHSSGDCTGGGQPQPGRLTLHCVTVRALIQMAYGYFANGTSYTANVLDIRGAPAWTDSEHYDIVATAGGETRQAVMRGPMLQTLLEKRFGLRFHHETLQGPVYLLTEAKRGAKLSRIPEGGCLPGAPVPCGTETRKRNGSVLTVNVHGIGVGAFADGLLSQLAGRRVIDQTGLEGLFDFHLEYAPDTEAANGGTVDVDVPSLAAALEDQLGLKLTRGTGVVPVFVIDHVERPSAN